MATRNPDPNAKLGKVEVMTDSDKSMLYDGINVTQLALLLKMERRDVSAKIFGKIQPVGERKGQPIYSPKEALPYLIKPAYDVEKYLQNMSPADLPKMLTKEYWAAMRSRQEFELKNGDLWPTAKVIAEVGELMKLVKMSALLTTDAVERQIELSDHQRSIIKNIMDGMLLDLYRSIQERFRLEQGITRNGDQDQAEESL